MKKLIVFIILIFAVAFSNAQSWKRNPASIMYGNGTNNFLGDLGGGKKDAAHFLGIRDIDIQATRPTWQIAYRYRIQDYFVLRANYTYALIAGKDQVSGIFSRQARNLSFRSGIYELSGQIEYYFVKEKGVGKSSFQSLKAFSPISAYVFLGFGGLYFNPKAKDPTTGKWIALQPLGTEGQFANPDGTPYTYTSFYDPSKQYTTPKPYSRIAAVLSMGIGIKYDLNKLWSVGFEISNRYTSTDYLDDTHDKYFNYSDFGLTPPSPYTQVFSDRHLIVDYSNNTVSQEQAEPYHSGKTMRGNPKYNDAYIISLITVYYKLGTSTKIRKPKYR